MVEIIPKIEQEHAPWRNIGNLFVALFVLMLAAFALLWYLRGATRDAISKTEADLASQQNPQDLALEAQVLGYESRIRNLKQLLSERRDALPFLAFLEEHAHKEIVFTNFTFSTRPKIMVLGGKTSDFGVVEEQLAIFQQSGNVQTRLANLGIGEQGEVVFQIELTFLNL